MYQMYLENFSWEILIKFLSHSVIRVLAEESKSVDSSLYTSRGKLLQKCHKKFP